MPRKRGEGLGIGRGDRAVERGRREGDNDDRAMASEAAQTGEAMEERVEGPRCIDVP